MTWVTAGEVRTRLAICLLPLAAVCSTVSGLTSPAADARAPHHFFGVFATSPSSDDAARMKKAHVGSLRALFSWPEIQPTKGGAYNWSNIDTTVARAASAHISVLPILNGTPSFEAPGCTSPKCPKRIQLGTKSQRRDWTAFVRAAVQRYGRNGDFWNQNPGLPSMPVELWETWNEENNPAQHNSVRVYSKMLALSDGAISSVDHHGKVMVGGLA